MLTRLFLTYCLLLLAYTGSPLISHQAPVQTKLNLKHETSFVVMPADLNHLGTLFGGKTMAEMDRTAGITVRRLLYASKTATVGVTKTASIEFHEPARTGDLILVTGKVTRLGDKSITIKVWVERDTPDGEVKIAEGLFVFVAYDPKEKKSVEHGLKLEEGK